jgi:hypothetical protein
MRSNRPMVRFLWLDPEAKIAWQAQAGGVWCMYAGRSHRAHGRRCGAASGDVSVAYTQHGGSKSETPGWGVPGMVVAGELHLRRRLMARRSKCSMH